MHCFREPGSVTISEINGELVTVDSFSDDCANDNYGKIIGMIFSPVSFQSYKLLLTPPPKLVSLYAPETKLLRMSWHKRKHILAFLSGSNQVTICDYEDQYSCILTNEKQINVSLIEWRPNAGKTLSGATWIPDGQLLVSFCWTSTIGSIKFPSKAPSLDAQFEQVDLLKRISSTGSYAIEKIEWDAEGERLAVSYNGGYEEYYGLIAIFNTTKADFSSSSLM
ncbi:aladin-like [Rutidosis leptorrhynchoides]|uniref:aladin-like n=1 Tax=Rutidosis leptorrhynchoides TaxID=125765 RepID=UPI003A997600